MRNFISTLLVSAIINNSYCQQILHDNVTGKPYMANTYDKTVGTPFLTDNWSSGVVYLRNGYKADKFLLKFDLYSNELLFKFEEQPLAFVSPVKEFLIKPVMNGEQKHFMFRCGYKPQEKYNESTFYIVLQDGPTALVKQIRKHIATVSSYGAGSDGREFVNTDVYFIARPGGELVKIKKDKSSLLAALNESSGKLETWVNKERLRCKNEEEMMNVVKAFNENTYQ